MPPRRKLSPASLEELCTVELMKYFEREVHFCHQVRKYQKDSLLLKRRCIDADTLHAELCRHLDCLPPLMSETVRQQLTNRLLKSYKTCINSASVLISLLDIVLNQEVKSLELEGSKIKPDSEIWQVLIKKCTGLQKFTFGSSFVTGIKATYIFQNNLMALISKCNFLTELVLKDSVNGLELLSTIGKSCHLLKILDLTGAQINCTDIIGLCTPADYYSYDVPHDEVYENDLYPLCQTMEKLILSNTQVRARGAAFVLGAMPNLISLGNFVFTAAGLKRLYGVKCKPRPSLKLQQAFYRGPSNIKIKVLVNCCPSLDTLFLGAEVLRRVDFQKLTSFKKLRSLTVENIHVDDVAEGLRHMPQLVELQISTSNMDLGIIAQCCPLLEKLCVTKEPLRSVTTCEKAFTELKEVRITCPISLECGTLLMTNSFKLKHVELVRVRDLSDAVFSHWLQKNPLTHLETLMLRYVELTRASVDMLLDRCPCLTKLGELGSWDIRSWECRRLRQYVLREKFALYLILYSRNTASISDILVENMSSDEAMDLA